MYFHFYSAKYKTILEKEQQHHFLWQKILKILKQTPLPEQQKKDVIDKASKRDASDIRMQRIKQKLTSYELLEIIGKGAFGEVRLGRCKKSGKIKLIKVRW